MSIYLVRHCSAEGQEPKASLTEAGKDQSLQLSSFLLQRGIKRILSSPFKRAVDSARPLADAARLPIEVDPCLAERNLGEFANGDWRSALKLSFDDFTLCLPNGESSVAAQARGVAVIHATLQAARLPAALFSHGNLLSLIANYFDDSRGFDFWRGLSNPDVYEVTRLGRSFVMARVWPQQSDPL